MSEDCPECDRDWKAVHERIREFEVEVERLKAENNALKIAILRVGGTPPGWIELVGGGRESGDVSCVRGGSATVTKKRPSQEGAAAKPAAPATHKHDDHCDWGNHCVD